MGNATFTNAGKETLSFSIAGADYVLEPGTSAELPPENKYVRGLVAQGHLTAAEKPANKRRN